MLSGRGIDGTLACSLAKRATDTSVRQVALVGCAARDSRDDVVNMERRLLSHLCESAILTAALGALDDERA